MQLSQLVSVFRLILTTNIYIYCYSLVGSNSIIWSNFLEIDISDNLMNGIQTAPRHWNLKVIDNTTINTAKVQFDSIEINTQINQIKQIERIKLMTKISDSLLVKWLVLRQNWHKLVGSYVLNYVDFLCTFAMFMPVDACIGI